jgi:hypothetical protein
MYGIGYPALISPVFLANAFPFLLLSMVHATLAGLYLAGTYVWVRRHAPEAALPIALLAVGNVIVLSILRRPLSEATFLPVMIWLINALAAIPRSRTVWRPLLAAIFLLTVLVLIRQAGIFFAAGFGLHLALLARQRELSWTRACVLTLAVGLPASCALGAMIVYDHTLAAHERTWSNVDILMRSQAQFPADYPGKPLLLLQCLEGVRMRVSEVGRLTLPGMFNARGKEGDWLNVNMLLYVPVFVLFVVGWLRFVRRRADVFALTLPLYVALYVYWPFDQGGRYFAPLLPLMLLCFWTALESLGQRRLLALRTLIVAHLVVALGYWICIDRPRALNDEYHWSEVHQMAEVFRGEPGTIEVAHGLGNVHLMLQYLLDQPVSQQLRGQPLQADVHWLIVAADAPATLGYQPSAAIGSYRLLHRARSTVAEGQTPP